MQSNASDAAAFFPCILWLGIYVLFAIGLWKTFEKAGQPGWAAIIPIVNLYFMCKVAGRPGWWIILFIIPVVSLIISIIVMLDIAKSFGRGVGFAIGLIFLGFIFFPILGFGDAQYQGPAGASA
jgi:hypothetical protein